MHRVFILTFFMTNHPFSYGWIFDNYEVLQLADWSHGDIGWVPITPEYKNSLRLIGNNCEDIMKPNGNWPQEEHEDILPNGEYSNYPRYYVKKRKASGDRTQYIASRSPIVRGLDEQNVKLDPDPVNANEDPDIFKDITKFKRRIQFADIFCDGSTITEARVHVKNSIKIVRECGVLETLTRLCMIDSQVTPTSNDLKPLIAETFDAAVPSIDARERDLTKTFVQDNCARFFRIETPIKSMNKPGWKLKMKQFTRGANSAGYKEFFCLDRGNDENGEVWVWKNIKSQELETREQDGNKETGYEELWFMSPYLWPNNNKRYWYFCCHKDNAECKL